VALAQILGFLWIQRSDWWPYRITPLMTFQGLAAVGSVVIYLSASTYLFGLSFALFGLCMAMTYSSSLFYSVYAEQRKGAKTGLHEGILGSGGVFGALLGGFVAGVFGLKAPYALCLAVLLIGMTAQARLYIRHVLASKQ
jgi:MFS family permease